MCPDCGILLNCFCECDKILFEFLFRYQSTVLGSYQTVELIETFMNYQVLSLNHVYYHFFML